MMAREWKRGKRGESVRATYGPYEIRRTPYGTKWTYQAFLNGERIPLAFSSRLMDVKAYVNRHAEGVTR
jgi:hypothetical protein